MKIQLTTMNSRDKNLLIFLAAVVAVFVIYYFIISPAWAKGSELSIEAKLAENQLVNAQNAVEQLPENRIKYSEQLQEITEKYKAFFYEINQERILYKLATLITNAGIPVISYTQTRPTVETIPVFQSKYQPLTYPILEDALILNDELLTKVASQNNNKSSSNSKEASSDAAAFTQITISFSEASYESVVSFLKQVETMDRAIVVQNINLMKNVEGTTLKGEIVLNLYSLAKPDKAENNDLIFEPTLPSGKANPFK